ncbi:hypothetical protein DFH08DRAFT_147837 [Mycena albidolilacea]|uniref:F-box domain-containing protein n=1 Tax=Mycena albidolilacea TaxID=1033008 RepID=A0AAD7A2L7_9AGAR|nr:hypothetical protein DFH08DRAFT_147837 [Mycena albidolilacea]
MAPQRNLESVMLHASTADLLSLCRTSRLISNIATSLLYHTVSLFAAAKMNSFLLTMKQRSESSALLSRYVRQFSIHEGPDLELSQALIEDITCVLSELEHLESLNLVSIIQVEPIEFMDLLHHAHFPNLLSFGLTVQPQTLSLLPFFLNRHQTMTDLSLIPVAHLDSEPLDPILLLNLKEYFGPSSFTSSFDLTSGSVSQVSLLWRPGDLLETPFPISAK